MRPTTVNPLGELAGDRTPALVERAVRLVDGPDATPRAGVPGERYRTDRAERNFLRMVLDLLVARTASRPDAADVVRRAAGDAGRSLAEREEPLEPALRAVRQGGRKVWSELLADIVTTDDPALCGVGSLIWEVVDEVCAEVAEAYHAAAAARMRGGERKRDLWEGLLCGLAEDPAFAHEAVRTLGLVGSPYVAIEVEDGDPLDLGRVCRSQSWLRRPTGSVGLVTVDERRLPDLFSHLADRAAHPVGASAPVTGPSQLARALAQCNLAVRIRAGRPGLTAFDRALPEALLRGSPEITAYLVSTWLGPLLELPEPERTELLRTLEAWLDAGASTSGAASLLYCHRNTVINRMRRISALVGRDLSVPAPIELALALRAVRMDRSG